MILSLNPQTHISSLLRQGTLFNPQLVSISVMIEGLSMNDLLGGDDSAPEEYIV